MSVLWPRLVLIGEDWYLISIGILKFVLNLKIRYPLLRILDYYLIEGTGKACALQINPIVPFIAKRKDIVVTDSD